MSALNPQPLSLPSTSRPSRRNDPVKTILNLVDKNKFNMPEGDYIEICRNLRHLHARSIPGVTRRLITKMVPRIVTMATVPVLILRSFFKFKKIKRAFNVMPNGSRFAIIRGDDKFILS